jgi:stage V sporulation protein AC
MNEETYGKIVKSKTAKEKKLYNMFIAFLIGGLMGVIGQLTSDFFYYVCDLPLRDSYMYTMIFLVVVAAILTGFGFFDKVTSFAKAGLLVPTTGFAHAMTSAAMDYRKEGLIRGIGGNIFKLTGSIILYGLVAAFFVALIKGVLS